MTKKESTVEENLEQAHKDCVASLNGPLSTETPPLYHYTDFNGGLSMLSSGKIRLTDARYFNDPDEIMKALELLQTVHNEIIQRYDRLDIGFGFTMTSVAHYLTVTNAISTRAQSTLQKAENAVKRYNAKTEGFPYVASDVYVACLSEKGDDLRQWIPYGSDGFGMALGFKKMQSQEIVKEAHLIKVCYEDERKKIDYIHGFYEAAYKVWKNRNISKIAGVGGLSEATIFLQEMYKHMYADVVACKSENYKDESEWRIFVIKETAKDKKMFRVSNNIIRPYIEAEIIKPSLEKIIIGPKSEKELNEHALKDALRQNDFQAKVTTSKILYR